MKTQWLLLLLCVFLFNSCHLAIAEEKTVSLPEVSSAMQDEDVLRVLEEAVLENKPEMILAAIMELRERWKTNPAIGDMMVEKIDDKAKNESYRLILINELVTPQGAIRMPEKRLMAPGQQEGYQKKMVKMLSARLEDTGDSSAVRGEAAIELGVVDKSKETVVVLTRALKDTDDEVSSRAAFGLKLVGDKDAVPALLSRLQELTNNPDEHPDLVRRTMVSLGRLGDEGITEPIRGITHPSPPLNTEEEQAIETIIAIARMTNNAAIFGSAVHSLGIMHKSQLISVILDLWNDANRFTIPADKAMAELSCWAAMRENEGMLIELLNGPDPETAMKAIQKVQCLHGVDDEDRAIGALQKHLVSPDQSIKILAIKTLSEFKTSQIKELLLEARKTEMNPDVLNVLDNSLLRQGVIIIDGKICTTETQ